MTLKCPRTQTDLKKTTLDGIELDISVTCGGVWFDNYELKKLDEAHEVAGDTLIEILKPYQKTKIDYTQRLHCPKCVNVVLMRNFYSPHRSIEIDVCGVCGGVWIDPGELTQIRSLFKTEEEKESYINAFVKEIVDTGSVDERRKILAQREQAEKVARALRFICPSNYIKGKQSWGAF